MRKRWRQFVVWFVCGILSKHKWGWQQNLSGHPWQTPHLTMDKVCTRCGYRVESYKLKVKP